MEQNSLYYFTSSENKSLLWNILLQNGYLNNFASEQIPKVKELFHKNFNNILSNSPPKTNLEDLNKVFIKNILQQIIDFNMKNNGITNSQVSVNSNEKNNVIKQFANLREEFEKSMTSNKPTDIDFSDNINQNNVDIEQKLSETINRRNLDISSIEKNNDLIKNINKVESETSLNEINSNELPFINDLGEFSQNTEIILKELLESQKKFFLFQEKHLKHITNILELSIKNQIKHNEFIKNHYETKTNKRNQEKKKISKSKVKSNDTKN